ncbi:LTA synthase family protein [Photobacterium profundum]|uniref:LTA synthase family protein n=1 Tax=Photobacterium profundum TaxID=74109 RepID=UPI003D0EEC94
MLDSFKRRSGIFYPIFTTFIICLFILTFSRVGLSLWQHDRVSDATGWSTILLSGLRIDISSLCYLLILPALLTCIILTKGTVGRIWLIILRLWIVASLWFVVYMELATPSFIMEYDVRPNRLFVEYLVYPKEVFGMLWSSYKLELFIGFVVSLITVVGGWKLSKHLVSNLSYPRWYWRPVLAVFIVAIGVIGARSTFGHRPLNPAMVAFSSDPLMNDLTLNSSYSLLFAVKQMSSEDDAFKYYGSMDSKKIIGLVRQSTGIPNDKFLSDSMPTLTTREATYKDKPKNLVILLQESLGARYVGGLGGLPLTPNIDALMQEGWNFTRMYATGTRSVRGIEAVTTGFSPTPARSVVKLGKSQTNFFTIAGLLKQKGYQTQFIYGGESHFDNMKTFFLGNGFVDMQDFPTFNNPNFVGSWGASDEDLYTKAHQQFTELEKKKKPFFSLVFTSSNHSPFDYPDGRITPYNSPKQTRENAAKYSDYALGEFINNAKASDYWNDTIFVVVADHDSRAYGNQLVPIDHFRIPAVIFGGGVEHKKDNRLTSQIDLPPTLLSMIGIDNTSPMIGHDMTKNIDESKLRAMMQFYKNYAWMDNNNNVVIFQPEKEAAGFRYDEKTTQLLNKELPENMIEMARANALWGSLAYKNDYYQSQTTQ